MTQPGADRWLAAGRQHVSLPERGLSWNGITLSTLLELVLTQLAANPTQWPLEHSWCAEYLSAVHAAPALPAVSCYMHATKATICLTNSNR